MTRSMSNPAAASSSLCAYARCPVDGWVGAKNTTRSHLPAGLLQSSRKAGHRLSCFAATKRPIVTLMKQARAFGVGCVLATQNPMDLDYRALSNAGTWMLGRLQTDADRARVVDGLGEDKKKSALASVLKLLGPRWFVMREARDTKLSLLNPRWAMSYRRGPMTGRELRRLREARR